MDRTDAFRYRLLLIGRAELAGILWGAIFGEATWFAVGLLAAVGGGEGNVSALLFLVAFAPLPAIVGGGVGATIGVTAGLALALSERQVLEQLGRAQLVTGSSAAALPLAAVLSLHRSPSLWGCLILTGFVTAAVVTGVLLTPQILHGPPPPAEWRRGLPPRTRATPAES